MNVDVVVVGGSIAGCTGARLYAQQGLSVALVEKRSDPSAYKALCGHFIQSSAVPTIKRLGLDALIEEADGRRNSVDLMTEWGTIPHPDGPYGYSIRRSKLDPMLRRLATETPGVTTLVGYTVTELLVDGGVVAKDADGNTVEIHARLVVGADGRNSAVAGLAGARTTRSPNARFCYMTYVEGLDIGETSRFWVVGRDVAIASPNDDGVTLLALFLHKDRLEAFKTARGEAFTETFLSLTGLPGLGTQTSKLVGFVDYPVIDRNAVPRTDVALIGDAAHSADPMMAIGCGWAFQTAEWLVDATASALRENRGLQRGLKRYARVRRSRLAGHQRVLKMAALGKELNAMERLLFSAAAHDRRLATRFHAFASRTNRVRNFINPLNISRAALVNLLR